MAQSLEIGGNYSLSDSQLLSEIGSEELTLPLFTEKWKSSILTSSGRGAISLLMKNMKGIKKVLLPIYTCDSVIKGFRDNSIDYEFYHISKDLSVDISNLNSLIESFTPNLILFHSYFGFDTLKETRKLYGDFRNKGICVIEDITHSWLSDFTIDGADYYIVSLRKWLELPDGGAILSNKHDLSFDFIQQEHTEIIDIFKKASKIKNDFFKTEDYKLKDMFRPLFYSVEDFFDETVEIYSISTLSLQIINNTNIDYIKSSRRKNYDLLVKGINNSLVTPIFKELSSNTVPLYLPVYVDGCRDKLQSFLAQNKIYCPIHWPLASDIQEKYGNEFYIYDNILSIVCDQRYSLEDMQRIVESINKFKI